ncbi:MFS transporter [Corynebacterium sp. H113]|uniref:MFS transporter n=1 Tax=Corynebacterium sp. H113 TaxID=3133419 RepID=UPI0030A80FCD
MAQTDRNASATSGSVVGGSAGSSTPTGTASTTRATQLSPQTDKRTVFAWGLWDWGSAAFNAVLVTFIFSVYLTDSVGKNIDSAILPSSWYGYAMGAAGIGIALIAPVVGQRTDARGTRKRSVIMWTLITVALMVSLFGIRNDGAIYFWVGITIMAVASLTFEFAEVSYFAMLRQVSSPDNVGRVSGFGWSMGYFGGIILLLLCYFGFVAGDGGLLNLNTDGGFNLRLVAVFAAVWFIVSSIPLFFRIREIEANPALQSSGIVDSYRQLFGSIAELWRTDRSAVFFLIASAIFRDGLAGVFTFGALLAVMDYGISASDVILFGVAANVVSALGALGSGFLDDAFGPKPVILGSLILMILDAAILYFVDGPTNFWIFGLILCLFVGPAQSASRTFLTRISPEGREGQMFGLYATTGRAVSWMAPIAFSTFVAIIGTNRAGIWGIILVLAVGAAVLLFVRSPELAKKPTAR